MAYKISDACISCAPAPTAALWVRFLRAIPSMSSARMPASTAALALTPALWCHFPGLIGNKKQRRRVRRCFFMLKRA